MNKQMRILLLLCGMVFFGLAAAQDVTRSCTAQYSVSVTSINGAAGQTYPSFSGQGTVGYFNPNEARRRARHNLDECVQAAWDNRYQVSKPTQCTETNQIFSYPFNMGLIPKIGIDLCSRYKAYDSLTIALSVVFSGDEGCLLDRNLWNTKLATDYLINCPNYEHEPGTNRLGGDYRNFYLDSPDWRLCKAECDNDTRCMAWTLVRPGIQDPTRAKCWLKSTVPGRRPSSCCDSGVKLFP